MAFKASQVSSRRNGSATESSALLAGEREAASSGREDAAADVPNIQVSVPRGIAIGISLGVLIFLQGMSLSSRYFSSSFSPFFTAFSSRGKDVC